MKLSIVIPAYNEEKRIARTLQDYITFFKKKKITFEIIVVLNGCVDNTLGIVNKFAKKHRQIRYKNFKEAIGKGGAIIEGFKAAKGDLIGFVDADNATKPKAFYDLVKKINDYDGIIASRWIKGAKINRKQPLKRRVASRGFNILVRTMFSIRLRDTQCGAKLFKKKAVKKVLPDLGITQWSFDIDLLYQMMRQGFNVIEIPTEWEDNEDSKLRLKKTVPEMFLSVVRLRLVYSRFGFVVNSYNWTVKNIFGK